MEQKKFISLDGRTIPEAEGNGSTAVNNEPLQIWNNQKATPDEQAEARKGISALKEKLGIPEQLIIDTRPDEKGAVVPEYKPRVVPLSQKFETKAKIIAIEREEREKARVEKVAQQKVGFWKKFKSFFGF